MFLGWWVSARYFHGNVNMACRCVIGFDYIPGYREVWGCSKLPFQSACQPTLTRRVYNCIMLQFYCFPIVSHHPALKPTHNICSVQFFFAGRLPESTYPKWLHRRLVVEASARATPLSKPWNMRTISDPTRPWSYLTHLYPALANTSWAYLTPPLSGLLTPGT